MEGTSKENKKWAEDLYWNNFHCIRFISHLTGDFQNQLAMPKKFCCNLRNKLPESVTLRGPSGNKWNVALVREDGALILKDGWETFVKDHSLEKDDVLIFQYNKESCFDVLLFGQSHCEKETSYFVKRCGDATHESGGQSKRKASEAFANNNAAQNSVRRVASSMYVSNRRPVTTMEKNAALVCARSAKTADSLEIVIHGPDAYGLFREHINDTNWCAKHFSSGSQLAVLQVKEKMWRVKVHRFGSSDHRTFTDGWKEFSLDNCLEEYDVCVFNPAGKHEGGSLILDVSIFRVVQEAVALSYVSKECGYIGSKGK